MKGAVHLAVVKPIRVTHLTVALRGFVRVYKNPNATSEPVPDSASEGVSQFRFLGNGYASLFRDEQVLCADGRLEAGKYEFNFELLFPEDGLPSSIEVSTCHIADSCCDLPRHGYPLQRAVADYYFSLSVEQLHTR